MAAKGHYVLHLWFLFSSTSFFLADSQWLEIGCLPYFHTQCGLSANLECMSEVCYTRLAEIQGGKITQSAHHPTTSQAISSELRHLSTIGKKLLNSNTSSICRHNMVNFGPPTAEIGWRVWGTPANFNGFRVTAPTSLNGGRPNFAWCLAISWAGTICIHFREFLPHNGILPGVKFTLRPSLALCYIGSIAARHSSSCRRQPNDGVVQEMELRNFRISSFSTGLHLYSEVGHHVGHRPTF